MSDASSALRNGSGFERMISDANRFLSPVYKFFEPLAVFLHSIGIIIVALIFISLMLYLILVRKHTVKKKLLNVRNYAFVFIMLMLYLFLQLPNRITSVIDINLGIIAIAMIAKQLGPIVTGFFGIFQYFVVLLFSTSGINIGAMLVAGISGIIYAMFIYESPSKYMTCLKAKLVVNIVCNIILVPMTSRSSDLAAIADGMTMRIFSNLAMVPIQAMVMYLGLIILKKCSKFLKKKHR